MTVARNQNQPPNGVTRDVQDELAKQRAEKRRQAGGPSPVLFHKDLLVGDDWSFMFLKRLCRGVSMYEFETPPKNALDLGCGSGLWVIEAAKAWPDSNFVGFDLRNVQPDLDQINLKIEYGDISKRIRWVHGDLLDPLPFESNQFDLVRICCIGLDIPEDSWQELLEECSRVLQHGGAIEIIEEDLLFPAGRTRKPDVNRTSNLRTISISRPSGERIRSDSAASKLSTLSAYTTQSSVTSTSSLAVTTEHTTQSNSGDSWSSSNLDPNQHFYMQDHAKLKRAWEEMLDRKFLSHNLLTVLPFYMSSFFSNVNVHPTMHILLPPPSYQRDPDMVEREAELDDEHLSQWLQSMRSGMVQLNGDPESRRANSAILSMRPSAATVTTWNTLHLARQFRLISACKEAIWEAYRALELNEEADGPTSGEPPRDEMHDEFEREWQAWENDMKDRMGTRSHIPDALSWKDPDNRSVRPRHTSSFRSSQAQSNRSTDGGRAEPDLDKAALCRAMRGFLAWKLDT